ncbi:translocation/assembly module TamB domain-containing protein [Ferruginibacter yonginensis]|uniref:Translocation/assembly module TamB domain-containing protein n=1 Tax=Ferruginibacter yonginensis TaxID=1310416 RepID=A0ABV8QSA7_9BACT
MYGILHLPAVQTYLAQKITTKLSKELHTKVSIKGVDVRFYNKVLLKGLYVEDLKKDTLLYAGTASASVNDWFFFKDKIKISNLGLDDALVNMKRTDSVWNYQFLVDYFSSPKKTKKSGGDDVAIDLNELHFNNIRFNKIDGWIGQDMIASLGKLDVEMELVDLKNKKVIVKRVFLNKPFFSQNDYEGKRPPLPNMQPVMEKIPVIGAFKWNNEGWDIKVNRFEVNDGAFKNDKQTEEPAYVDRFDGKHLYFSNINGTINNLHFFRDTLSANINLNASERSGLAIKKLESYMKLTPEMMEFNNLDLMTNKSRLRDYYAMKYESFNEDFSSFLHNVSLIAHFKESNIHSDDLAIFAPALKTWKRNIILEGDAKGPLDNFSAANMTIKTGNTILQGNIAMRGLPDIEATFIDFQSKQLQTSYSDMVTIVPSLKSVQNPAIAKLGNIRFTGNFTGFIRDFVAYGTFNSALGNITADVNMKIPENKTPAYSGSISSTNFNIGSFIKSPFLGSVALNAKVVGSGFDVNNIKAKVTGNVASIGLGNYNYKNIEIDGDFEKKLFVGHLSINDPNLQIPNLDGALNLDPKKPGFALQAFVKKANLKNLRLTQDDFSFNGNLDLNFTGLNIDDFLGTAKITNAGLLHNGNNLSFDSLTVTSELVGGKKSLSLSSNEIDASVVGNFKIKELPDAVRVLLAKYYPTYIKAPNYIVKSTQDFEFNIKTYNVDPFINLIDKKLGGFNNAAINGRFNLQNYDMALNVTVPQFSYDGKVFTNTVLKGQGNKDSLINDIAIEDIAINDSLHLPFSKLRVAASNNVSLIKLNTSASRIFGDAELNATVQTLDDGIKIHFFPSSFVINNKKWSLDKDGELTLRKNFIDANEVKFTQGNQEIVISTELSEENSDTHLVAKLSNVAIDDFAFLIGNNPSLKGYVTGTATANDIFGKTSFNFKGRADSFQFNNKYVGTINTEADANLQTGLINFKADAAEKEFDFAVNGFYNFKDSTGNNLKIKTLARKLNIDILQPYLSTIFSDLKGIANGIIEINSENKNLTIIGDANITGGSFKVAYTQVRYNFNQHVIKFGKDVLDIGTMTVRDTLGNIGTVSGKMYHHFFKDFNFENVRFTSPKIILLNTTKKDNSQFYGNVIGRGNMSLNGGITNMKMNIDGEPSATDSSHIYLPTGSSKESNVVDYIEFIQFGSLVDNDPSGKDATNLVVELDVTASPSCKIDVILDEETGDVIKGEGNGQLNIRVGTKEPLTMRGRYDLTKGEYTFNFQTFLKKPFTLKKGSITWNGDPFLAIIDMEAEYLAKNVDISSITSLSNVRQQEDILIKSNITGNLKKPIINFEFQLPERSEFNRDFYVTKRLADFKNDENEMNKQVASMLLFNQFISTNQAFLTGNSTLALATSTIGGAVSAWLTSTLSKALEKATKGIVSVLIDVNPSLNLQQANQLQANVRSSLKFKISQNLQLLVGGNIDYNNPVTQLYSKGVITPDISLEWLINKDGSLRVVGFNRTTIDFTTGQRNRSGVQLSYRKDVDRLGDIFRSKKKIAQLDSIRYAPKKKI